MQKPTKRSRQEKECARNQEVRLSMDPERRRPRRLLRRLKLNIRLLFIGETERFPKLMGGRFWRVDHGWQCIGVEGGAWTLSRGRLGWVTSTASLSTCQGLSVLATAKS